jgi:hypothetical protein
VHSEVAVGWVAHFSVLGFLIQTARCRSGLAVSFFNGKFRTLEANAAVGAITERLVDRTAAAAQGECGFTGEVIRSSVGIDEFDGTFGSFHAEWAIGADGDFHLSHEYYFLQTLRVYSKDKKITLSGDSCRGKIQSSARPAGGGARSTRLSDFGG